MSRTICLAFGLLLLAAGCNSVPKEAAKQRDFHLDQGHYYFTYGRYPQAAHQFHKSLSFDATSYEAQVGLGYCYRAIGRGLGSRGDGYKKGVRFFRQAAYYLSQAAEQNSGDIRIPMGYGWLYYDWGIAERKRVAELQGLLDGLLKSFPERSESYERLIEQTLVTSAEHLRQSETYLLAAHTQQPTNGFVLQTLALTLAQIGRQRYRDSAVYMTQFRDQSLALRAKAEAQLKERYALLDDTQLQVFKGQIANLKSLERKSRVFLGWVYYSLGTGEDGQPVDRSYIEMATAELTAVIALDPDSPNQHLNLAHIYDKTGQHGKAVAELKKYLKKNQIGEVQTNLYAKQWLKTRN